MNLLRVEKYKRPINYKIYRKNNKTDSSFLIAVELEHNTRGFRTKNFHSTHLYVCFHHVLHN